VVRQRRQRRMVRTEAVLSDLYALAAQHQGEHAHDVAVLDALRGERGDVRGTLALLEQEGLARRDTAGRWLITPAGRARCEQRNGAGDSGP
jgi:hypothetical protein